MIMIATWEGNKQMITNVDNPNDIRMTRELQGDTLVITQTNGDVTARRILVRCLVFDNTEIGILNKEVTQYEHDE